MVADSTLGESHCPEKRRKGTCEHISVRETDKKDFVVQGIIWTDRAVAPHRLQEARLFLPGPTSSL